jgi:hypothetical protein
MLKKLLLKRILLFLSCSLLSSISFSQDACPLLPLTTPPISASGDTILCSGGGVWLHTTKLQGLGYVWYKDGVIVPSYDTTVWAATSGIYSVKTYSLCSEDTAVSRGMRITVSSPSPPAIAPGGTIYTCSNQVILTSSPAANYQWYVDSIPIPGATFQTYIANTNGSYQVSTQNSCGIGISPATFVTIAASIKADFQFTDSVFCQLPATVRFTNLSNADQYYWNFGDGSNESTEINPSHSYSAPGVYMVTLFAYGVQCADTIKKSVKIELASSPVVPNISVSGDTSFCSGPNGGVWLTTNKINDLKYQWLKDGMLIQNAIDTSYFATSSGTYSLRVYNNCKTDSAVSRGVQVNVSSSPSQPIVTANGPLNFCNGGSVTLTSSTTTNNQWYKDGVIISGATNQAYIASAAGSYTVVYSSACGSATSDPAIVTTSSTPAVITTPPIYISGDTTLCSGNSVWLYTSKINGVSYVWLKNGTPVTSGSIHDTGYVATSAGLYSVRIYNTCNNDSATSATVTISANNVPAVPTISASEQTTFCSSDSVLLTSSSAANYQWYKDGVVIPGAIHQSYIVHQGGSYKVSTSNSCNTSFSAPITITISPLPSAPSIILLGNGSSICSGDSVQLSTALISGITYQWKKYGVNINGATSNTYMVRQTGDYSVTLSNGNCSATSSDFPILVNSVPAPTITASGSGNICQGSTALLTSSANSGNQWYKDGVLMNSDTLKTYMASTPGVYTVRITNNGCLSPSSNSINVSLIQPQTTINSISATPNTLWPPDHRLVDVQIDYVSTSNCGTPACVLTVSSNEPQNGLGDGDIDNDWQILDDHHIRLRAERGGNGNGRIYTISIKCASAGGDTTTKTVTVFVQNKPLEITTQSNPTTTNFVVTVRSSDAQTIDMRVLDTRGNVIEVRRNVQRNTPIILGSTYDPGLYYVEFIQGDNTEVVKLMKLGL